MNSSFLKRPSKEWIDDTSFINGKEKIKNMRVVNDSAERGVKLASDFNKASHSEERFQQVLQVVVNSRHGMPDLREKRQSSPRHIVFDPLNSSTLLKVKI